MKSVFLKKIAEQQAKKTATKTMTKKQFEKIRKAKKQTNDLAKKNNIEVGTGKYGVLSDKLNKSIGNKNLSEANKIMKDMKDFIKDIKDKPVVKKAGRKQKFATMAEARQAAKDAGKKYFRFGNKTRIPVERKRAVRQDLSELKKDMTTEEKKKFTAKRDNELAKLKKQQLKEMMSDKYGGGTSLGGVRVQKLTPEGEKLLKENKLSTIVNAQKFIKFKTKSGKEKTMPSNKYIVEGIGSRDAPLVPKGAVPKTKEDKKAFREYFENEMDDSQRLEYILQRFEPQYTSSQLADILGITARDLTATIKGGKGKYKQYGIGEAELRALQDRFQVRAISKDMKIGGSIRPIIKVDKDGKIKQTGKKRLKDGTIAVQPEGGIKYIPNKKGGGSVGDKLREEFSKLSRVKGKTGGTISVEEMDKIMRKVGIESGVFEKPVNKKDGGMVKYKSGTGKKTIGKKDLTGLTNKQKKERQSLIREAIKDLPTTKKLKSGTKKSTIGKVRDYVKKSPIKSAMGALGAYEVYDVGKYAMDTLGPLMGFKSGTKGKTIRGCGKAMRGFGKAMIKKGKK